MYVQIKERLSPKVNDAFLSVSDFPLFPKIIQSPGKMLHFSREKINFYPQKFLTTFFSPSILQICTHPPTVAENPHLPLHFKMSSYFRSIYMYVLLA